MPRHGVTAQVTADPATGDVPTGRRRGLFRWPIRRKLVALVAVPLLVLLAVGAYLTTEAVRDLREAQDAEKITNAAAASNQLSQWLQRELGATLNVIRAPARATRGGVGFTRAGSDQAFGQLAAALRDAPRGGWDVRTRDRVDLVNQQRGQLAAVRKLIFPGGIPQDGGDDKIQAKPQLADVVAGYGRVIEAPRVLTQQLGNRLAYAMSDGSTTNTAAAIAGIAEVSTSASQEVVLTDEALSKGTASVGEQQRIAASRLRQKDLFTLAKIHSADPWQGDVDAITADDARIDANFRDDADKVIGNGDGGAAARAAGVALLPTYVAGMSQRLVNIDTLAAKVVATGQARARDAAHAALVRLATVAGSALLVLLLVTAFTAAVARSVSGPLRRLRSAAVETANVRLPAAVRQIDREGPDAHVVLPPALPAGQAGGPETAEVARAVDGLTDQSLRLATAQVRLRRSLDDAFVSMSRRSQSMVEKQLAIIDELERTEEDPEQLRNLFRLDHLAARMRRYNDNLLVLAGSVVRTRSNAPVPIADVFRAATSEMEQYERVRLQPVSGAAVAGPAAGGLIHLLAELLDNAAMYSPPTSPILMAAAFTPDGALRLEITDAGVGIPGSELSELNARLAAPGSFDMQVPSRMGLYVVARLAQRGGFAVRLAQRQGAAGTVAEVSVPPQLVIGGGGLMGEPPRTPTSLPQVGADVPAGRAPAKPAREVPASATGARRMAEPERATGLLRRTPGAPLSPVPQVDAPVAEAPGNGSLPRRTRGEVPAASGEKAARERTPGRVGARAVGTPGTPAPDAPAPVAPAPQDDAPALPSRRPGAALAGGPLGSAPLTGAPLTGAPLTGAPLTGAPVADGTPFASPPPGAPSPFAASAAAPPEAPSGNGTQAPAARNGGGFGAPGRSLAASAPATGAETGPGTGPTGLRRAGAPSAATAAAAARAARSGASAAGAAELFAARGPATDGRGSEPVPPAPVQDAGRERPDVVRAVPGDDRRPSGPTDVPADAPTNGQADAEGPAAVEAPRRAAGADAPRPHTQEDVPVNTTGSVREAPPLPAAPAAWDPAPATAAARRGTPAAPQPARAAVPAPAEPLSGEVPVASAERAGTPIYDTVSTWFTADGDAGDAARDGERIIDLRDRPEGRRSHTSSARWSALGDQRWMATNARAAAAPEVAGNTEVGLPRRRPGANLIPSAATAAPHSLVGRAESPRRAPATAGAPAGGLGRVDADAVRGRLASYQRGLTSARRARHLPADRSNTALFAGGGDDDPGARPESREEN